MEKFVNFVCGQILGFLLLLSTWFRTGIFQLARKCRDRIVACIVIPYNVISSKLKSHLVDLCESSQFASLSPPNRIFSFLLTTNSFTVKNDTQVKVCLNIFGFERIRYPFRV